MNIKQYPHIYLIPTKYISNIYFFLNYSNDFLVAPIYPILAFNFIFLIIYVISIYNTASIYYLG